MSKLELPTRECTRCAHRQPPTRLSSLRNRSDPPSVNERSTRDQLPIPHFHTRSPFRCLTCIQIRRKGRFSTRDRPKPRRRPRSSPARAESPRSIRGWCLQARPFPASRPLATSSIFSKPICPEGEARSGSVLKPKPLRHRRTTPCWSPLSAARLKSHAAVRHLFRTVVQSPHYSKTTAQFPTCMRCTR